MLSQAQIPLVPGKLRPPQPHSTWIPRRRLSSRLAVDCRLTLVVAPAGFGKSTAVAQWLHMVQAGRAAVGATTLDTAVHQLSSDVPAIAWLGLDEHDQDALHVLAYIGAISLLRGDPQPAASWLHEGVERLAQVGDRTFLFYGLLGCSALASFEAQPGRSVVLYAAATRQATESGLSVSLAMLDIAHVRVEHARERMLPEHYERATRHGQSMSLEQTIALALAVSSAPNSRRLRETAPAEAAPRT